jgi:hypothetical protein
MWLRQRGRLKAHRERTKSGRIAARASHDRSHAGASPTTRVPEWSFVFISFLHLPLASLGKLLPCLRHIFKLLTVVRSSGSRHFPAFSGVVEILLNLFHAVRFPIEKIASALSVAQRGLCGADRGSDWMDLHSQISMIDALVRPIPIGHVDKTAAPVIGSLQGAESVFQKCPAPSRLRLPIIVQIDGLAPFRYRTLRRSV